MNTIRRASIASGMAAFTVGCVALQPLPKSSNPESTTHAPEIGALVKGNAPGQGNSAAVAPMPVAAKGTLSFAVMWPERQVMAIPGNAESILITINSLGSEVGRTLLVRPGGGFAATSTASITIEAQSSLLVVAKAYASASPANGDLVLAQASSTSVQVMDGVDTQVRLTLAPPSVPNIASLYPDNGGKLATASAVGTGFGLSSNSPFTVGLVSGDSTSDMSATAVRSASGAQEVITFTVPNTAINGNVVVTVNGQISNTPAFKIIGLLRISPTAPSVAKNATLQLTAQASDSNLLFQIPNPAVNWMLGEDNFKQSGASGSLIAELTAAGKLKGLNAGTASVIVSSGKASHSVTITVTP